MLRSAAHARLPAPVGPGHPSRPPSPPPAQPAAFPAEALTAEASSPVHGGWGHPSLSDGTPPQARRTLASSSTAGTNPAAGASLKRLRQEMSLAPAFAEPEEMPSPRLQTRRVQEAPRALRELHTLTENLGRFAALHLRHQGRPSMDEESTLTLYGTLCGAPLSRGQLSLGREALDVFAVQGILDRLHEITLALGGPSPSALGFERLRGACSQALQAIHSLRLGPALYAQIGLGPVVRALGGEQARMELLLPLMQLPGALTRVAPGLHQDTAYSVMKLRYARGPQARVDQALLAWMHEDLAPRLDFEPGTLTDDDGLPDEDPYFRLIQGATDAFLQAGERPLIRLHELASFLMHRAATTASASRSQQCLPLMLSAALDGCGTALAPLPSLMGALQQLAQVVLTAWASHRERLQPGVLLHVVERLSFRGGIRWLPAAFPWDAQALCQMIDGGQVALDSASRTEALAAVRLLRDAQDARRRDRRLSESGTPSPRPHDAEPGVDGAATARSRTGDAAPVGPAEWLADPRADPRATSRPFGEAKGSAR